MLDVARNLYQNGPASADYLARQQIKRIEQLERKYFPATRHPKPCHPAICHKHPTQTQLRF